MPGPLKRVRRSGRTSWRPLCCIVDDTEERGLLPLPAVYGLECIPPPGPEGGDFRPAGHQIPHCARDVFDVRFLDGDPTPRVLNDLAHRWVPRDEDGNAMCHVVKEAVRQRVVEVLAPIEEDDSHIHRGIDW